VVADHAPDIVMFDVPPPDGGLRGIGAYRDAWPPFFEWQRSGAVFEITELNVTAGADVGFAFALLRSPRLNPTGARVQVLDIPYRHHSSCIVKS
jgi:ketosteroid isomerase-like protein